MKHTSLFIAATVLLTLSQMAFAADMVTYHDCRNQDGSMSYRIYPCDKGQIEVRKFDVDLDELARVENGKSTINKQQSQSTVGTDIGGTKRATNKVAAPTYSGAERAERCEVKEYMELWDMPNSSLIETYCSYKRWGDIHSATKNCFKCLEAAVVCSDQVVRIFQVIENRVRENRIRVPNC